MLPRAPQRLSASGHILRCDADQFKQCNIIVAGAPSAAAFDHAADFYQMRLGDDAVADGGEFARLFYRGIGRIGKRALRAAHRFVIQLPHL